MNPVFKLVYTGLKTIFGTILGVPNVGLEEIAAAMLEQAVNGIEKDTLLNEDLVRIGRKVLDEQSK